MFGRRRRAAELRERLAEVTAERDRWQALACRFGDDYEAYREQVVRDLNEAFERGKRAEAGDGENPLEWCVVGYDGDACEALTGVISSYEDAGDALDRERERHHDPPYDRIALQARIKARSWCDVTDPAKLACMGLVHVDGRSS